MLDPALLDDLPPKKFQFIGGVLCLDYCNTMGGKRGVVAREKLQSYNDFICWCEQAGLLDAVQTSSLKNRARSGPEEADLVLVRALELRETVYRMFLAIIEGAKPSPTDVAALNGELEKTMGRMRIGPSQTGSGFGWHWAQEPLGLEAPLGPLAHSAALLLTSEHDLDHVRQCRADNCGWLFIDASKNHSRCWCDMRDCGNRAKVRRHRQRQQSI